MSEPAVTEPSEPKRFLVRTFGCQMNEHDSERIAGQFSAEGMVATDDLSDADVVVLNTCCIRENADNKLYGTLGHLKSLKDERPGLEIVVSGCLAQKDKETIRERAPYVDLVFGTHNVHRASELLQKSRSEGPLTEILEATVANDHELFPSAMPAKRELGHAAWVTIQIGCDNSCAFCIVPAVRGPEISRPFDRLVDEVEALAATGVTEVTLLGQNVNSYGRDLTLAARQSGKDVRIRPLFADLLRAVGAVEGIRRVRYTSPHPKDLRPETIEAMAQTPSVCEHLHLPVQSGSDRVLAAMHRGYTADRYLARLSEARRAIDDLAVTTDLIVGFPGETEQDFQETLELAAAAEYDSAYTFIYSPRPGTEAAEMVEQYVDPKVVGDRFDRLKAVLERSALRKHEERIGRTEEVVIEGPSRKDPSVFTGRTRQNKLVHFPSDTHIKAGSYADVLVTGAAPHFLRGELVAITEIARHRTRLAVSAG